MDWMLLPYRRYSDFQGPSRRKEYWMFCLLTFLVSIGFDVLMLSTGGFSGGPSAIGVLLSLVFAVFSLGSLVPSIAVGVRRLHDQDKSGWFVLIALIPLIGSLALIVLLCLDGTRGANKFGPDPKQDGPAEVF
jgi:uncharacterized membrane protein YhaH (DUF805 family)